MTSKEKNYICKLKDKGLSYNKIAKQTGFSEDTIKIFRRENLQNNDEKIKNFHSL